MDWTPSVDMLGKDVYLSLLETRSLHGVIEEKAATLLRDMGIYWYADELTIIFYLK